MIDSSAGFVGDLIQNLSKPVKNTSSDFRQALELGQNILVKSKFDDCWLSFRGIPMSEEISEATEVLILKGKGCVGNGRDFKALKDAGLDLEGYAANTKGWKVTKPWEVK